MRADGRRGMARERRIPGSMNRVESEYASYLEGLRLEGRIRRWSFEAVTLKLAQGVRLTPDFFIINSDGTMEFHDTKATKKKEGKEHFLMTDEARIKMRTAAEIFPEFGFAFVRRTNLDSIVWVWLEF